LPPVCGGNYPDGHHPCCFQRKWEARLGRETQSITADVQGSGSDPRRVREIIRYETEGEKTFAVCEGLDGDRWYELILINGEPLH
jgi:hypothetical protein